MLNKSIVASLGLPLLIQRAEKIKAIVIMLDYKIFTNDGNFGGDFEKKSKNLFQLLTYFEKNKDKLKILFAITKPSPNGFKKKDIFNSEKFFKNIRKRVEDLKENIESEEYNQIFKEQEKSKIDCEEKIEVYKELI